MSHNLLDRFVEAGGNFIDTADIYQFGMSETIIGRWLVKRPELRSKLIIATKVWGPMDKDDTNARGLSRHHIMQAVEQSLKRLHTDYIDLYQVSSTHSPSSFLSSLNFFSRSLNKLFRIEHPLAKNFWNTQSHSQATPLAKWNGMQ